MSRRLYLGRLPLDTRADDISKHFDGYGRIVDCRVMTGFGFVEFESSKDADDVVHHFNGKNLMGQSIIVEFAKESRRREPDSGGGGGRRGPPPSRGGGARKPGGVRLTITGISRDTSWQDLKDFGREAGSVMFADVDRDGSGVLEYPTLEDAELAVKTLDGRELRGVAVRLAIDERAASGGGGGGGGYRDRSPPPRRDRSRSPYSRRDDRGDRRDYHNSDRDRRRSRSPPPKRYDDRRDDRDRDYRRDDRGGDRDRDSRRDDRPRGGGGEDGWESKPEPAASVTNEQSPKN